MAYIAYVEENCQLVPRAKFETKMMKLLTEYIYCQWYSMTALTLFFLMTVLVVLLVALHPKV